MTGISHLPAFLLAATLIILIPGPATLFVAGRVRFGARSGFAATAGIVAGDVVLIALSGLGFAALVAQWPSLIDVIKFLGGLYIAYLGLEMLNSPSQTVDTRDVVSAKGEGFFEAIMITLTNPKPILFFAAFFPMFIDQSAHSHLRSYVELGVMFEVLNTLYFMALIAIIARLRRVRMGSLSMQIVSAWGLLLCSAFIFLA